MFGPIGLLGTVFVFAFFAGIVILVMRMNRTNFRRDVGRSEVRTYAKRYLKRFPDTKRKNLRESLRQEFLPERIGKQSDDAAMAGCFLFGLGGALAAAAGHAAVASLGDGEIKRIQDLIEDVLDDTYAEDAP